MTRIFRYVLKSDSGMAPCIDAGWLSLATCKPKIRASARPEDWVVGFCPRPAAVGLVAWAGCISRRLEIGDYEKEFRGRRDAVYRVKPNGEFKRLRPDYHPGENEIRKDTSAPVLVFDPNKTWYFGNRPKEIPNGLIHLAAKGQGHRVNGATDADHSAMLAWLSGIDRLGIHGTPRQLTLPVAARRDCVAHPFCG